MHWVRLFGFVSLMLVFCSQVAAQQVACTFETDILSLDGDASLLGADSGDLDGDGDFDIIVFQGGTDSMAVLKNDGTGQFSLFSSFVPPMLGIDSPNPRLGDLDGDGDLDVVFEAFNNELMYLYFNDGTGTFGDEQIFQHPDRNTRPNVADLDGDGDLDIVISVDPVFLYIYFNDGFGNFAEPLIFTPGNTFGRPALRDFDNDSDIDIVVTTTNDIVAYLNDGTGTFGRELPRTMKAPQEP